MSKHGKVRISTRRTLDASPMKHFPNETLDSLLFTMGNFVARYLRVSDTFFSFFFLRFVPFVASTSQDKRKTRSQPILEVYRIITAIQRRNTPLLGSKFRWEIAGRFSNETKHPCHGICGEAALNADSPRFYDVGCSQIAMYSITSGRGHPKRVADSCLPIC